MRHDETEILRVETLSDAWNRLERFTARQRRSDGTTQEIVREVYRNGPGAAVLPFHAPSGRVLLVRQFRMPALANGDTPWLVEAIAGIVEEGKDAAATVRAEAEQETGHAIHDLRPVGSFYTSPGACAEIIALFLAAYDPAARSGAGGGLAEEGEDIEVLDLPFEHAWAMVATGEIRDAKTVLLLQALKLDLAGAR
jgi:nudix-type nucleoside diphosphatase (YffH/AdpP family)